MCHVLKLTHYSTFDQKYLNQGRKLEINSRYSSIKQNKMYYSAMAVFN